MPSKFQVMLNFENNYQLVLHHLTELTEQNVAANVREKAADLLTIYTDISFITMFEFHFDLVEVLKTTAVDFQSGSGILIGKGEVMQNLYTNLRQLKTTNGKHLKKFLSHCFCFATQEDADLVRAAQHIV